MIQKFTWWNLNYFMSIIDKNKIVISCIYITRIRRFVIWKSETGAWPWSIHKLKYDVNLIRSAVKSNIKGGYPVIWLVYLLILWSSSYFIYIYAAVFNNFNIQLNSIVAEFSQINWIRLQNYSLCSLRITWLWHVKMWRWFFPSVPCLV